MTRADSSTRGDITREVLIEAALDVFGHDGFDAASTRRIARKAGVNQALIGYHFGGKRGLYEAVFEHIAAQMQLRMEPVALEVRARLEQLPATGTIRRQKALELLAQIFEALIGMFGEYSATGWVRLVLREQQDPSPAFDIMYDRLMGRMLQLITQLLAIATGMDAASEACRIRALMLLGQVLVFHVARGSTSRHMQWQVLSEEHLTELKKQFRLSLEAQFSTGASE